jgi:polyferredoxin
MAKLDRKPGLIRYDSRNGFEGKRTRWMRPRTLLYTVLALFGAIALTFETSSLKSATVSLTRVTGIPYVVEGGVVRNQFIVRVLNKRNAPITFKLEIADGPQTLHATGMEGGFTVAPLGEEIRTVVLTLPRADLKTELPLRFRILSGDGTIIEKTATFLGPIIP